MNALNYIHSQRPKLKGTPTKELSDFLTGDDIISLMDGYKDYKDPLKTNGKRLMYTDGSCKGNGVGQRKGGWAYSVLNESEEEIGFDSGHESNTTNQRMEMKAVIEGLKKFNEGSEVEVLSDSAYIVNCFNEDWISGWKKRNWKTSKKEPVKNKDLWEELIALVNKHSVTFTKVAGHSGVKWNERVDILASDAASNS